MIDTQSDNGAYADHIARRAEQGFCVYCGASDIHPEVAQCTNTYCALKVRLDSHGDRNAA